jgi:excisionase family DNA binding protein
VTGDGQDMTASGSRTPLRGRSTPLLSVEEVGRLSGLHPEVVRRAIRRLELRASKLCGRYRVRQEHFEAWIEENAVAKGTWQ